VPASASLMLEAMQASRVWGAGKRGAALDFDAGRGGNGGAIDEYFTRRADEQRIARRGKNGQLGRVIGDDGEDDCGGGGDGGEGVAGLRAEFGGERGGGGAVGVVAGGDGEPLGGEAAGHVRAHAADADEGDSWFHKLVGQEAKKGLCNFSSATVVSGPWPEAMMVWSGRERISARVVRSAVA